MGMQVKTGGSGEMSEPNIVPFIDVLLVLIIIFMVITPLTPKGLEALIPQPAPIEIGGASRIEVCDLGKTVVARLLAFRTVPAQMPFPQVGTVMSGQHFRQRRQLW